MNLEVGKTYEVYIYYHNNADAHEVGKTAIGIADGASMKSNFPATVMAGETGTISGTVFASDTDPKEVWDEAYVHASDDVYLRYVTGSATIHNGGELNGSAISADYLFGDGTLLGYNSFSGILPGCNEYAGYVTYDLYVDQPNFTVQKSIVGDQTTFRAGDTVTFKVRYENTGTMDQKNVVMRDLIPDGLDYVEGSAILYNNNLTEGKNVNDDLISENGINIGDYAGGDGWAELTYQAVVQSGLDCGTEITNTVRVSTTDGDKTASTTLTVDDGNCTPSEETCATNPNLPGCSELPNTGPVEIAMVVAIVLGIFGGGYYLYRSNRKLDSVKKTALGRKGGKK